MSPIDKSYASGPGIGLAARQVPVSCLKNSTVLLHTKGLKSAAQLASLRPEIVNTPGRGSSPSERLLTHAWAEFAAGPLMLDGREGFKAG